VKRFIAAAGISLVLGACSVGMAISGKEDPDLRVVRIGATRADVESQLGKPVQTASLEQGMIAGAYSYQTGNAPSMARAFGHAIADLVTLGLWELAGTPIERGHEEKRHLVVWYDDAGKVIATRTLESPGMLQTVASAEKPVSHSASAATPVAAPAETPKAPELVAASAPAMANPGPDKAVPTVTPRETVPANEGPYRIQLASLRSREGAEREGERLRVRWPEVFDARALVIMEKDIPRRGRFFRVQLRGFGTLEEARAMCAVLLAGKQPCFPAKP